MPDLICRAIKSLASIAGYPEAATAVILEMAGCAEVPAQNGAKAEAEPPASAERSGYEGEATQQQKMQRVVSGKKKKAAGKAKGVFQKAPVQGKAAPRTAEWRQKCTDDGHRVGTMQAPGMSFSVAACISEGGRSCMLNKYFSGECRLD